MYAFGYDKNNNNHKILMIFYDKRNYYQIYDLKSDSWRDFNDIPSWDIDFYHGSASVNGNSYFWTKERILVESSDEDDTPNFLICFDFTAERFGQFLPLPFDYKSDDYGTLSCVKEEKLAALYMRWGSVEMEIWVTTKIEPNQVLWSNFKKVAMEPHFTCNFRLNHEAGSFFFDQEKKVAMGFGLDRSDCCKIKAFIIGENRHLKKVGLGNVVITFLPT
ncbi:F-box protein [Cardamine amara subsp. amara]|uniref:F-box protein n=1 Tax=Cardamine amara subsp. amara TaxID=228776 RepID=A0ABD0ZTC8_CARAN